MKKVRFMKKLIGGCIAAMILATATGNQQGEECSVCGDDDIGEGVDDVPERPVTPLS